MLTDTTADNVAVSNLDGNVWFGEITTKFTICCVLPL